MCVDCSDKYGQSVTDKCVTYQGPDNELLGICKGDKLSKIEEVLIDKILSLLDGTGLTLDDLNFTDAPELKTLLAAKDPTLVNIIQMLIDNDKSLRDILDGLSQEEIFVFDKKCLTFAGEITRDSALQAVATLLCSLQTTVNAIPTTYVKNTEFVGKVEDVISGKTSSTTLQYNSRMVPDCPQLYTGSLSKFDNTGKGYPALGFEKIYIMNGLNGTLDWRGRTGVGAVRNVPGAALDSAVDPTNPLNPNTNYLIGDKGGENFHKLTLPEIPKHSHTVVDTGHIHNINMYINDSGISQQPNGLYAESDNHAVGTVRKTESATTGISIGSSGGDLAHENRQPFAVGVWIIYKPE